MHSWNDNEEDVVDGVVMMIMLLRTLVVGCEWRCCENDNSAIVKKLCVCKTQLKISTKKTRPVTKEISSNSKSISTGKFKSMCKH